MKQTVRVYIYQGNFIMNWASKKRISITKNAENQCQASLLHVQNYQ
jgi:hypothetical protein